MADRIATMSRSVQAEEAMGMRTGIDAALALYQLVHARNFHKNAMLLEVEGLKRSVAERTAKQRHP